MKLEDRMRQSIRRRSGTVVLRSDVAALGSQTQVTHALDALLREGVLLRLATGVYAKATHEDPGGRVRPQGDIEAIIRETARKWGLVLPGVVPREVVGGAGDDATALVVETDTPRISRKLVIDGKLVEFRSRRRKRRDEEGRRSLTIPTAGIASFVRDLARRYKVAYVPSSMDQWADTVTRLAGDEIRSDSTQDLLVALKRAGKLSKGDVAALTVNYLRERKQHVRSV